MPPVNSANILALANFIASRCDLPFNMHEYTLPDACGTPGCIGGFGAALWPECTADWLFDPASVAAKLGINSSQLEELFFPRNFAKFCDTSEPVLYRLVTRAGAVQTLRRLAATGAVQWWLHEQSQTPVPSESQP